MVKTYDEEIWGQCIALQYNSLEYEEICISIRWLYFRCCIFVEGHYGVDNFSGNPVGTN